MNKAPRFIEMRKYGIDSHNGSAKSEVEGMTKFPI